MPLLTHPTPIPNTTSLAYLPLALLPRTSSSQHLILGRGSLGPLHPTPYPGAGLAWSPPPDTLSWGGARLVPST
eukprot:scaffold61976_cov35-Cyclotella_meneghiniana.AAC.1